MDARWMLDGCSKDGVVVLVVDACRVSVILCHCVLSGIFLVALSSVAAYPSIRTFRSRPGSGYQSLTVAYSTSTLGTGLPSSSIIMPEV